MDPVSFAAATGIACAGDFVPLDANLHQMTPNRVVYIQTLIGMVLDMKETHTFKVDSIKAYYIRERVIAATTSHETDQVVRAFLLYL